MRTLLRVAVLSLALFIARTAESAPPKLVVLLVVDQMRADYVDWYGARWTGGLRRLYDQGAWLRNARYPYLNTMTCPGHFTLSTGAYPHRHGMISNNWYDHGRRKLVDCTDDPGAPLLAHSPGTRPEGNSARNLLVPTLAEEMAAQLEPKPQIAAFSFKARSAIGLAARLPAVVMWFEAGHWTTSTAFAPAMPPWVQRFVKANPVGPTPALLDRWSSSPAPDDYLARLASESLTQMKLGQGRATDFLAVSFSMTDLIGHKFGPSSAQVQEALARLDVSLGQLLAALDRQVGPKNYVVALSADHGVAPLPEETRAAGPNAGRLIPSDLKRAADAIVAAELGDRNLVIEAPGNDIYLAPGVHARLTAKAGAMTRVLRALRALPGVAEAFDKSEVASPAQAKDARRRAAALSYHPGRSGDLLLIHKANWVVGATGTNHGSIHDYDQHVPVIFFGSGIKPGRYDRAVSPADVAPTLAKLAGIELPRAEGAAIQEVIDVASGGRR